MSTTFGIKVKPELTGYPEKTWSPRFSIDWDWIMPVLEKIERENNSFCEIRQSVDIVNGQRKVVGWEVLLWKHDLSTIVSKSNVKLDAVYRAVVDYIKWYNEKNK